MAPELFALKSPEGNQPTNATNKTDVWSLGIILHSMLSGGKHPFNDKREILEKPINPESLGVWAVTTDETKTMITKLLERDVEKRYSAANILADVWFTEDTAIITMAEYLMGI